MNVRGPQPQNDQQLCTQGPAEEIGGGRVGGEVPVATSHSCSIEQ